MALVGSSFGLTFYVRGMNGSNDVISQRHGGEPDICPSPVMCGLQGVHTYVLLYTVLTKIQRKKLCVPVLKSLLFFFFNIFIGV